MAWVAVAVGGSALLGAGMSYLGAQTQADAALQAGQTQADAYNRGIQAQQEMYNQTRTDLQPYRDVGQSSLYTLADLMGLSMTDTSGNAIPQSNNFGSLTQSFDLSKFYTDPGYQWRLSQGQEALDRAASSQGSFYSGAYGKALSDYNQNQASQEYQNAYNRYNTDQNTLYSRYAGLVNTGASAAGQTASANMQNASALGSLYTGQGSALGNSYMNAANATASGYTGIANAANSAAGNYLFYNAMNNMGSSYTTPSWANTQINNSYLGSNGLTNMSYDTRYLGK